MAGVDLLRPVELLQEHAAHKQVRPGHHAEREDRIGALDDRGPKPLGAADREGEGACAAVAPSREPVGEIAARPGRALWVERDEPGAGRPGGEDQLGLAQLERGGRQAALFFQLDERDRWREAPGIERLQFIERPAPQPADGEEVEADRRAPLRGRPRRRSRYPAAPRPTSFRDCNRRGFPAERCAR